MSPVGSPCACFLERIAVESAQRQGHRLPPQSRSRRSSGPLKGYEFIPRFTEQLLARACSRPRQFSGIRHANALGKFAQQASREEIESFFVAQNDVS